MEDFLQGISNYNLIMMAGIALLSLMFGQLIGWAFQVKFTGMCLAVICCTLFNALYVNSLILDTKARFNSVSEVFIETIEDKLYAGFTACGKTQTNVISTYSELCGSNQVFK